MRMLLALAASTTILAPSFANAVQGVTWDGGTSMISYVDPFQVPQSGTSNRMYMFHVRLASLGQIVDGRVVLRQIMPAFDNYNWSVMVSLSDGTSAINSGETCPELYWLIQNNGWDSLTPPQQGTWYRANCDVRPDPTLYSSGNPMTLEVNIQDFNGNWLIADWIDFVPMNGQMYDLQVYAFTGRSGAPAYAKAVIAQVGGSSGGIFDPSYVDTSNNYTGLDGFDIPMKGMFRQVASFSTDPNYAPYYDYTGDMAEMWEDSTYDDTTLAPTVIFAGEFLNAGDNTAPDLGQYGEVPIGNVPPFIPTPPLEYLSGDQTLFTLNRADLPFTGNPQTYIQELQYKNDPSINPNHNPIAGIGIQTSSQNW